MNTLLSTTYDFGGNEIVGLIRRVYPEIDNQLAMEGTTYTVSFHANSVVLSIHISEPQTEERK